VYESASGVSERVVYPFGVFAYRGFWYCACHDQERGKKVTLRADRFRKVEPVGRFERPSHIPLEGWVGEDGGGEMLELRAHVSERAVKSFELATLFGRIEADPGGRGIIEVRVPSSGIDFYAARLLGLGTDVRVESPPELIAAMRQKAWAIARLYPRGADPELDAGTPG
jgi:predicted DNA-binding transcriptional regulator YafY